MYILEYDFSQFYSTADTEVLWSMLIDVLSASIDQFVPKLRIRKSHQPKWFNSSIRHQLNIINTLRRKISHHPSPHLKEKLARLENVLQTDMVNAKADFESTLIHQSIIQSNSGIYKYIRSLYKLNNIPLSMHLNNKVATVDDQKATLFNEYFHSIYSSPSIIPAFEQLPSSHLGIECIRSITISEEDIYKALSSLDPNKAKGIDNFGPSLLKQCSLALTAPLYHLFNTSISSGSIPSQWRTHLITPIFKSGDRSSVSNYRPISLLPIISKVLERLIYDKIILHITPQLSNSQFGFLRGKSCLHQLLLFIDQILHNDANKLQSDVLYLDFRKAFDSVSHSILLEKLWKMGLRDTLWIWFKSYLTNRSQVVRVNQAISSQLPVLSGVPQGSILGPLLFLIFINDLPDCVKYARMFIFADDTKLLLPIRDSVDSIHLQSDIHSVINWSKSNNINFNDKKFVLLSFENKSSPPTSYII